MIVNTSEIGRVDLALHSDELTPLLDTSNNGKFNMAALISTLTDLSIDPAAMLNVITLLSHMIYQATTTLGEIEDTITAETVNRDVAQAQADAIINGAQGVLDAALARRASESPVLNDEISMLHSVINTLGGDNMDCLTGAPEDACGRELWSNGVVLDEGDRSPERCLDMQRATYEDSVGALAIMYRALDGHCMVYNIARFDECPNIDWIQSDFTLNQHYQICRVSIE